jgi:hypothetical protein
MHLLFTFAGLIAAGLMLVWIVRRLLGGLAEASALVLVLAPLILYGIANGAIAEFSGFGVTTKFNKAADIKVTELAGALAIKSRLADTDFARAAEFQQCNNYFIVRDDLGNRSADPTFLNYAGKVASAIKSSLLCGSFYGVVVVDRYDHFLGLFEAERFLSILAYPLDRYCIFDYKHCADKIDVSDILGETELGVILKNPDVRVQTEEAKKHVIQESQSLSELIKDKSFPQASVFAVLDKSGKFVGLLPKQAIYDKIISVLLDAH